MNTPWKFAAMTAIAFAGATSFAMSGEAPEVILTTTPTTAVPSESTLLIPTTSTTKPSIQTQVQKVANAPKKSAPLPTTTSTTYPETMPEWIEEAQKNIPDNSEMEVTDCEWINGCDDLDRDYVNP